MGGRATSVAVRARRAALLAGAPSPRRAPGRSGTAARRRVRDAGHVLAQGVHPAHDAVPRPLRLLHVRQAAGPARRAVPHARRGARDRPRAAPQLGCHEALFTLGEAPEARYPQARRVARRPRLRVDRRLPRRASPSWCSTRPACSPTPTRARCSQAELERLRAVSPSQGMMIETLAARLGEPGGPHHGAPDKTPERRLATLEAAGRARVPFTTGILVGIGETRAERIDALEAIADAHRAPRPRARGDRPELPAQAGHRDAHAPTPCPPDEFLWSIAAARLVLPADVHLQAPPNLSDDLAPLLAAGIDDWGGVSPVTLDHVNPERPWPALERLRAATEAAGNVLAPRLTIYPEFVARRRRRGSHPDAAHRRCSSRSDSKASRATTTWSPGRDDLAPPPLLAVAASRRAPGGAGRRGARRRARGRGGRRRRDRHAARRARSRGRARSPRSPTSCGARSTATRSRSSATATSTTRTSARSSAGSARSRRARCRSTCAAQPYLARARGDAAARRRGGRVRRDRGVPAGRHPSRLRRRLLRRRRARGEGGRARRSTCTASPRSR